MFTERRIINAIKQNLLDAMSRDHRVFVVGSVDCISNGTSAPCVHYQLGELERALAYIDAEQLQLLPSRPTPAHGCPSGVPLKQQTYYMQWEKTRRCYNEVVRYEREAGVCFDWVVRTHGQRVEEHRAAHWRVSVRRGHNHQHLGHEPWQ